MAKEFLKTNVTNMSKHRITKVCVDDTHVYAMTETGLTASYAFSQWPKLAKATKEQREDYQLSYSGIHWPKTDEDLNFESMFNDNGLCQITEAEDSFYFISHK